MSLCCIIVLDIDDEEINTYILSNEEAELKARFWMKLNGEHLAEMERKCAFYCELTNSQKDLYFYILLSEGVVLDFLLLWIAFFELYFINLYDALRMNITIHCGQVGFVLTSSCHFLIKLSCGGKIKQFCFIGRRNKKLAGFISFFGESSALVIFKCRSCRNSYTWQGSELKR